MRHDSQDMSSTIPDSHHGWAQSRPKWKAYLLKTTRAAVPRTQMMTIKRRTKKGDWIINLPPVLISSDNGYIH